MSKTGLNLGMNFCTDTLIKNDFNYAESYGEIAVKLGVVLLDLELYFPEAFEMIKENIRPYNN